MPYYSAISIIVQTLCLQVIIIKYRLNISTTGTKICSIPNSLLEAWTYPWCWRDREREVEWWTLMQAQYSESSLLSVILNINYCYSVILLLYNIHSLVCSIKKVSCDRDLLLRWPMSMSVHAHVHFMRHVTVTCANY